ncbi:helix-turn-helix domain-containing protein [Lentzea rhizosphaerae]|uniref:Helix-turn-helix domain-containing protein n=1 Tax=Lentzea rhizosphaerae TaxID=2041025 RepID=A0ABV8C812_9PSEU
MPSDKTYRKSKLGRLLDQLRKDAGKDLGYLASELRKTEAHLSKCLNGTNLLGWADLGLFLDLVEADEDRRRKATEYWEDAKQDSTRVQHPAAYNQAARSYARAEADASQLKQVEAVWIPGMLQVPEYTLALREAAHRFVNPKVPANRTVAARQSRQMRLHGDAPLQAHFLIDIAALRRAVGGPAAMYAQLLHLMAAAALPNVTIQVIGEDAGAYAIDGVTILSFDDEDFPDVVYLETRGGGRWVENDVDVDKFRKSFNEIAEELAFTPEESLKIIREQAELFKERLQRHDEP